MKWLIVLFLVSLFSLFLIIEPRITGFVSNVTVQRFKTFPFTYEVVRYPAKVEIIKKNGSLNLGMSADPWILDFGSFPPGVGSKKIINLENPTNKTYRVELRARGNISGMIKFDKNDFLLEKGGKMKVSVLLNSSLSKIGNYSGEVDIIYKWISCPCLDFLIRVI